MRGFSFLQILMDVLVETWGVYREKAPASSWNARIYAFLRRNLRYYCLASALLMTLLIWNRPWEYRLIPWVMVLVLWGYGFYFYWKIKRREDGGLH